MQLRCVVPGSTTRSDLSSLAVSQDGLAGNETSAMELIETGARFGAAPLAAITATFETKAEHIIKMTSANPGGYKWVGIRGHWEVQAIQYFANQIVNEVSALGSILWALDTLPQYTMEVSEVDSTKHYAIIKITGGGCTAYWWLALAVCPEVTGEDHTKSYRNYDCSKCTDGYLNVEQHLQLYGDNSNSPSCTVVSAAPCYGMRQ